MSEWIVEYQKISITAQACRQRMNLGLLSKKLGANRLAASVTSETGRPLSTTLSHADAHSPL